MSSIKKSEYVIELSALDSDWNFADSFPQVSQLVIHSIEFSPAAANDKLVIRDGGPLGPVFFEVTCSAITDNRNKEFGRIPVKPYLVYAEGVYTAGCRVIIILHEPAQPVIR